MTATFSSPICDQDHLVPILNQYLQSKKDPTVLEGACKGLVFHHCFTKFQGKRSEHFDLVTQVCRDKFEEISQSDNLQKFFGRVVKFHDINIKNLQEKINQSADLKELGLHSSFYFAAPFPYNSSTGSHDKLADLLKTIVSTAKTAEKYIFLSTDDHSLGIDVEEDSHIYYDPNFRRLPPSQMNFSEIAKDLTLYSKKQSLVLSIEVITKGDFSNEMNQSEELNALKMQLLKSDLNQRNIKGYTSFMFAMAERHFDVAWTLFRNGARVDEFSREGGEPSLLIAGYANDTEALEVLVSMNADINIDVRDGRTPIWFLAYYGHLSSVQFLLAKGAKVKKDKHDVSPQAAVVYYVQTYLNPEVKAEDQRKNDERYKNYQEILRLLNEAEPTLAVHETLWKGASD